MRLIDAEPIERELFKWADKSLAKNPYENAKICAFRRAFEMVLNAPTIAPPPNDPLTLEDLRKMWEMDENMVYLDFGGVGEWVLVQLRLNKIFFLHKKGISAPAENAFRLGGKVYRRKPDPSLVEGGKS